MLAGEIFRFREGVEFAFWSWEIERREGTTMSKGRRSLEQPFLQSAREARDREQRSGFAFSWKVGRYFATSNFFWQRH